MMLHVIHLVMPTDVYHTPRFTVILPRPSLAPKALFRIVSDFPPNFPGLPGTPAPLGLVGLPLSTLRDAKLPAIRPAHY